MGSMAISIQGFQATQTSTTTSVHPTRGIRAQIKQDVQQLSTALQSGDLASAQQSYGDLQKLLQGNGSIGKASTATVPAPGPLDTVRSDFQSLGKDLQSGDLAAAQKDYAQLAKDSQQLVAQQEAAGGGRAEGHRHGDHGSDDDGDGGGDTSGTTASTTTSTSTSTTTSTPVATPPLTTPPPATATTSSPAPTPQTASNTSSSYRFSVAASYTSSSSGAQVSTSPRIGNSFTDPATDPFATLKKDFQTIGNDLQAGNLDGVQKDYAQLVKDAQNVFSPSGSASTALTSASPSSESTLASSTQPSASGTSATSSTSADQFQLNASFQSTSATVTNGNQTASYQSASFEETIQTASSNQQGSQVSAYQFKASFQSQSVNVFA